MKKLYATSKFEVVEGQVATLKNVMTLEWACELNLDDCVKKSQTLFDEYKKENGVR